MHLSIQQHPVSITKVISSLKNIRSKTANRFNSANSEKQDELKKKQLQQRMIKSIELSDLTSHER